MIPDLARVCATPAQLLTHLIDANRSPTELAWCRGTVSQLRRWFVAEECEPQVIVVDPQACPEEPVFPYIVNHARREWEGGAQWPKSWLHELWCRAGGVPAVDILNDETLQCVLHLLPRLQQRSPSPEAVGAFFAILLQHSVSAESLPLETSIVNSDETILDTHAPLADALLRLRLPAVERSSAARLTAGGWIAPGMGAFRNPGPTARLILDILPHRWIRFEFELLWPDPRPVVGHVTLGEATVLVPQYTED